MSQDALRIALKALLRFSWEGSSVNFPARTALNQIRGLGPEGARLIDEVRAEMAAERQGEGAVPDQRRKMAPRRKKKKKVSRQRASQLRASAKGLCEQCRQPMESWRVGRSRCLGCEEKRYPVVKSRCSRCGEVGHTKPRCPP